MPPPLVYCYHHVVSQDAYRKVSPKIVDLFVSVEGFEKEISQLLEQGYRFLTAREFMQCYQEQSSERAVLLTFDDGQENTYHQAYPILKRHGLPAVFFLITSRIDTPGYLTSQQLLEMNDLVSYHSHTHQLHNMQAIKRANLRQKISDLEESLEFIDRFNRAEESSVRLFAYPFSISDRFLLEAIKRMAFDFAFRVDNRAINYANHNRFRLPRLIGGTYRRPP
jgi:peptidoglycan/xylan/chitin deacetylase (PgdA/CDA1 family)